MRKFLVLTLALVISFLFPFTQEALAASATLSLSPASGTFNKGCNFSTDVIVDTGGAQTAGTDVILFYDPTRLQALNVVNGRIYSDYPANTIDQQNGKVSISGLTSMSSPFTGQGTFATVNFKVLADAPEGATQITFDFDPTNKAKTTDSNVAEVTTVADVLSQVNNGSYIIGSGSCAGVTPTGVAPTLRPTIPQGEPITSPTPTSTTKPLPTSADFSSTLTIAVAGAILTLIAIVGLTIL